MKTKLYQVIIAKSDSSDDNLYTYAFPPITSKKVERIRFNEVVAAEIEEANEEADGTPVITESDNEFEMKYTRNGASQVVRVRLKEYEVEI